MTDVEPIDQLLSVPEVAVALGCSRMHVYRLLGFRLLDTVDISLPGPTKTKTRITRSSLERYIDERSAKEA